MNTIYSLDQLKTDTSKLGFDLVLSPGNSGTTHYCIRYRGTEVCRSHIEVTPPIVAFLQIQAFLLGIKHEREEDNGIAYAETLDDSGYSVMCTNYDVLSVREAIELFGVGFEMPKDWKPEVYQDYMAPILVSRDEGRQVLHATYGMIPKKRLPPGAKFSTMNARAESIGEKHSFRSAWQRCQLCLVPMLQFYEPCYETGKPVRYKIGLLGGFPFAVAGLFRAWKEDDGELSFSFTQITVNADGHPVMSRFHKPEDEKRSLVIIEREDYDAWLTCRDPEIARTFLKLYPAEKMHAEPAETGYSRR